MSPAYNFDEIFVTVSNAPPEISATIDPPTLPVVLAGNIGPPGPPGEDGGVGPQGPPGQWTQMTQAAYDALGTKDPNTLYVIVG